ncbi:MAG: hypothetical protein AB7P01_18270 [Bacteroidia bacterium]
MAKLPKKPKAPKMPKTPKMSASATVWENFETRCKNLNKAYAAKVADWQKKVNALKKGETTKSRIAQKAKKGLAGF